MDEYEKEAIHIQEMDGKCLIKECAACRHNLEDIAKHMHKGFIPRSKVKIMRDNWINSRDTCPEDMPEHRVCAENIVSTLTLLLGEESDG